MTKKDESHVLTEKKVDIKEPDMYRVVLINDDYTTMEFVTYVLKSVFYLTVEQAERTMLKVHREGRGVCGVYPYEIAEMKVNIVAEMAKQHEYPLLCVMEEDR
ncbi:MAG: ATP-dependent Clp protease adapter ClpS [Acidobacteria bacterium]|nr:MAG: ATP-dependent Clp protease adapter ClpS [Acidobacteriota bacterium]PIE90984.1 MAG: ATP-dependent Clp protease adapter ClpS [Acidobacteriota bacterium]